MKDRELQDYINDLIEAFEDILSFTKGMSYSDFANDRKTINAVIRSLEVIGEATKICLCLSGILTPIYHGEVWRVCGIN